ncbi:GAS2L1 (predicted) [Pycnogonum litorale]
MVTMDTIIDHDVAEDSGVTKGSDYPEFRQLERRPFRPFKSSEEYLYAMKEDLAEWLNTLYGFDLTADNFMERLETGVTLCRHANSVRKVAIEWQSKVASRAGGTFLASLNQPPVPASDVICRVGVQPGTFQARDNVSNFITWCRSLGIYDCLLFETDDLVLRKNEKSFILCLLEVARQGTKFGMLAPTLVQMEQEIDEELARDQQQKDGGAGDSEGEGHDADDDDSSENNEPPAQVITNDLKSLHEMVKDLLKRCTCPSQFPMIRVSEGKYRIGDTKVLIFVRILRNHVMVRVGGGWDTLAHYLDKHDPCRCRSGHRVSTSAKLNVIQNKTGSQMHVTYNRAPPGGKTPSNVLPSPQRTRRSSNPSYLHVAEKDKFSHTIHFPENESQTRRSRNASRPLSQLSDESSASSIGGVVVHPQINGHHPTASGNDSSSELSENENRVGSWVAGVRARKCSPRKYLRIENDNPKSNLYTEERNHDSERVTTNRYSSDCSSLMSPEEQTTRPEDSPKSMKTLTGNGSDSSGIDVSCENLQDVEQAASKAKIEKNSSKIPTPKSETRSRIPSLTRTPPTGGGSSSSLKKVKLKSQSTDNLNAQPTRNDCSNSGRKLLQPAANNPTRRRSTSQVTAGCSAASPRMPRSRSATGEGTAPAFGNLNREGPGRYSYRSPRSCETNRSRIDVGGNKTWTFRQRDARPTVTTETYMNPTTASIQRRKSTESSKNRLPLRSTENSDRTPVRNVSFSASSSPTREISPLLKEILSNEDELNDDTKILQKMEMLVNQYKARVEAANVKSNEEQQHKSKNRSRRANKWNSTGDLSDEGRTTTIRSHENPNVRKMSEPPSSSADGGDDNDKNDTQSRQRRDSATKIPMPRWYTRKQTN